MKLYYVPGSSSLAPHIVLREADRRFDLERVDLRTRRTAGGRDYREINPKGYVPTLELDGAGSERLTEVQVILQYIGDLVPDARLVAPSGTFARYHLQEWLAFIGGSLHAPLRVLLEDETAAAYRTVVRGNLGERFAWLQEVLTDRAFLMGESFTVADAYLFVMLQWAPRVGVDIAQWPHLEDYESRISHRPAVEAALATEGLLHRHRYQRSA